MKPDLPAVVCSSPHCWLYMPRKRRMPQQMPSRSQCPQAGRRYRARMARRKAAETGSRQLIKVSALTAVALWRWKMKAMPKSAAVRSSAAWPIWKRGMVCGGGLGFIAILIKSHTRRAAEDSTRLYGEAAQRRMRLYEDC